jgi:hypothetical protein
VALCVTGSQFVSVTGQFSRRFSLVIPSSHATPILVGLPFIEAN